MTNSKRIYSGTPNYSDKRGKDDDGKGAAGEDGKGEDGKAEAPPPETDPDKIKQNNMEMWAPAFKAFFGFKQVKYKLKEPVKAQKEEKIAFKEDDIQSYVSGSGDLSKYFMEDLDKIYLMDAEFKKLLDTMTKGSEGQPVRQLLPGIESKGNEAALTPLIPELIKQVLPNVKRAVQYKGLTDVINYIITTKEFKAHHKSEKISGEKENIVSGEKSKEEASLSNKEKNGEGKGAAAAAPEEKGDGAAEEGGASEGGGAAEGGAELGSDTSSVYESDGGSISSGTSGGTNVSGDTNVSDGTNVSGDSNSTTSSYPSDEEDGSTLDGGKIFKTAEEKEYKKFKKGERADLGEKVKAFIADTPVVTAFIDTNLDTLSSIYTKNTFSKNVDKKSPAIGDIIPLLFTAIDTYEKKPEEVGAHLIKPEPAAADGKDAKDGKDTKDKPEGEDKAAPTGDAAAPPAGAAPPPGDKGGGDGIIQGGGGAVDANTVEANEVDANTLDGGGKQKKKRFTRKKPRHINININVGDKNVIENSSSSSSCSSSSSSSSSSSDSSTSDDDEKDRKQKYVVNKVKRVKHSKLRQTKI